ncbi:MAG: hypothetical protein WDN06_08770 [Asticcacaulis sp.]
MSQYTGLSVDFILKCDLRIDLDRFQKELLRDQHETVGRYDSRFMGVDSDDAGEGPDYDASDVGINSVFASSLRAYLSSDLNYKTDMDYRLGAYTDDSFKWNWKHNPAQGYGQEMPDVAVDLGAAMRQNPHLKLLSVNGYYDMATPFFATEYDIAHIPMKPATVKNITFKYYPSGHMIYLNPDAPDVIGRRSRHLLRPGRSPIALSSTSLHDNGERTRAEQHEGDQVRDCSADARLLYRRPRHLLQRQRLAHPRRTGALATATTSTPTRRPPGSSKSSSCARPWRRSTRLPSTSNSLSRAWVSASTPSWSSVTAFSSSNSRSVRIPSTAMPSNRSRTMRST